MLTIRAERTTLIVSDAFVGLTAIGGGLALLLGWIQPPLDILRGSPFPNYVVPGLALLVIVGGTATAAAVALFERRRFGIFASFASGVFMMVFEVVEIAVIGLGSWLQSFYFVIGLLIAVVTFRLWTTEGPTVPNHRQPAA